MVTGAIEPCIIEEFGETVSNIPDITNLFCIVFWDEKARTCAAKFYDTSLSGRCLTFFTHRLRKAN